MWQLRQLLYEAGTERKRMPKCHLLRVLRLPHRDNRAIYSLRCLSTRVRFACAALFLSNRLAFLSRTASSMSRSFRTRPLDDAASPSALKSICVRTDTKPRAEGDTSDHYTIL